MPIKKKKKQRIVRKAAKPGKVSEAKIRAAVKKIKEEEFEVALTKDVAGSPQTTKKSTCAANPSDAITQAKQGDPATYDEITIKKKKPGAPVRAEPMTTARTNVNTQGMAGFGESKKKTRKRRTTVEAFKLTENYSNNKFDYPYSIMLPAAFDGLIEDIVKKVDLKLSERYSRLYILVPNAKVMDVFVESLVKKAKGKDKDPRAVIVISGIMGSIK